MNIKSLAEELIRLVGGEANVETVVHCATRLRFSLRDEDKADVAAIENLDGVITTVTGSGQFQVVIGNRVADVYRELGNFTALLEDGHKSGQKPAKRIGSRIGHLIDIVSAIFTPLLGAMAAAGVLKGLLNIATSQGWMVKTESTYIILQAASDSLFYFLPIMLAITTARKFQGNVFVAVSIAGALIYPSMIDLFTRQVDVTFFGIQVVMMKYTSTVVPIIFSVYVMCHLERLFNKFIHETVRSIITPFLLLVIMVPLTLITLGPVGIYTSEAAAGVFVAIFSYNPIIASALFAALWQVFVIFGMHWAFTPVIINDITVLGRSTLKASTVPAVFAQAGAVLGVMFKTKNKKMKALAGSTFITALFGITEPAVYGVTLKLKKPFVCAVIAAAVGGGVVGYSNSAAISTGIPSLLTLPIFYGEGFGGLILGIVISFVMAGVLTYIVGFDDPVEEPAAALVTQSSPSCPVMAVPTGVAEQIMVPIAGRVIALEQVNDKVFSSGIVGDGIAIQPVNGQVYSPVNGVVTAAFDSGHALQILSDNGAEVLIHIGLDTVQLDGEHYVMHVTENQCVKQGDLLIEFDLEAIGQAGYDTITPVIITNSEQYKGFHKTHQPEAIAGDVLLTLS
ncbi:PTS system beta-glucoside-specific IIABC component [Enterobacterales bacterium]|nr:PTS system beta-glucoside-specific IIABC component [Enterobacterales bacterium]